MLRRADGTKSSLLRVVRSSLHLLLLGVVRPVVRSGAVDRGRAIDGGPRLTAPVRPRARRLAADGSHPRAGLSAPSCRLEPFATTRPAARPPTIRFSPLDARVTSVAWRMSSSPLCACRPAAARTPGSYATSSCASTAELVGSVGIRSDSGHESGLRPSGWPPRTDYAKWDPTSRNRSAPTRRRWLGRATRAVSKLAFAGALVSS